MVFGCGVGRLTNRLFPGISRLEAESPLRGSGWFGAEVGMGSESEKSQRIPNGLSGFPPLLLWLCTQRPPTPALQRSASSPHRTARCPLPSALSRAAHPRFHNYSLTLAHKNSSPNSVRLLSSCYYALTRTSNDLERLQCCSAPMGGPFHCQ